MASISAVQVSTNDTHSCAVTRDGGLYCWGQNMFGALGQGSDETLYGQLRVDGDWSFASAGGDHFGHTCAIDRERRLFCWGGNGDLQLGIGDTGSVNVPTQVALADVVDVAALSAATCAVDASDRLHCWGWNGNDRLGVEISGSNTGDPTLVGGVAAAKSVFGDEALGCAIDEAGAMYCWGNGGSGQLGIPATDASLPVVVLPGSSFRDGGAGDEHACGIQVDGTLWCWGDNTMGQLGIAASGTAIAPTQVGAENDWVGVAAGTAHTCGLHEDGRVECWGANDAGQLGDGGFDPRGLPAPVVEVDDFVQIDAAGTFSCGVATDGVVYCWGGNGSRMAGFDGPRSAVPLAVSLVD